MIKLSSDRKVQGIAGEKNSFGLPALKTCPGKTHVCGLVCYANKGFFRMPNAEKQYEHNLQTTNLLLSMGTEIASNIFAEEIRKENKSGIFRWMIGGDIYNAKMFDLVIETARKTPEITHWIYTRSFKIIFDYDFEHKGLPKNLKLNLSFDKVNVHKPIYQWVEGLRVEHQVRPYLHTITWLGVEDAEPKLWFGNRKWITCPVDGKTLALEGGCMNCKLCFNGSGRKYGIFFPIRASEENICRVKHLVSE
jgi:hypothetical protein